MDKLLQICSVTREESSRRQQIMPSRLLYERIADMPATRGFVASLQAKVNVSKTGLIAEIKRCSPSGGTIRSQLDPAKIAMLYAESGAACLSVLTDNPFFGGTPDDLHMARNACNLPTLRKDFILDPWQVLETRAMGADAILLILAALSDYQAAELQALSHELGLDVLIEVHDEAELERALRLPKSPELLGINNRNLKTLTTDLATTEQLIKHIPCDKTLVVSESGIHSAADIKRMKDVGVMCFLVGESLLRQPDISNAVKKLLDC